ncbi:MAG: hypothetical protein IPG38_12020 [Chitinophagaceae bacterium]|nr:hypothetical protein [Chitinophagaceae bacterium]
MVLLQNPIPKLSWQHTITERQMPATTGWHVCLAIWDEKEERLFAARDRFGEKPFYYYEDEANFIFASEMKALCTIGIENILTIKCSSIISRWGMCKTVLTRNRHFSKTFMCYPHPTTWLLNLHRAIFQKL